MREDAEIQREPVCSRVSQTGSVKVRHWTHISSLCFLLMLCFPVGFLFFFNFVDFIILTIYWSQCTLCIWRLNFWFPICKPLSYMGRHWVKVTNYLVCSWKHRVLSEKSERLTSSSEPGPTWFPEISQARRFDSVIPRSQTEEPRLVLLWLHLSGDSDGSKLGSGGGSQCVWWLYCSTYSVEKLLADAPLGKEGHDLTWFPLLAWDGPGPTHSLEGRFLNIGRCFCLCNFSLCDLYQMKFPSPLVVSSWVHWTRVVMGGKLIRG